MCGIVGVAGSELAARYVIPMLVYLNHRGQANCGVTSYDGKYFHSHKGVGLVTEVFKDYSIKDYNLKGELAVGHVRYPTSGSNINEDIQPIIIDQPGIAIAHNGQINDVNDDLSHFFEKKHIHPKTKIDLEYLAHPLAENIKKQTIEEGITKEHIKNAVAATMLQIKNSAYSVIAIIEDYLIAFRDPYGIRPLVYGKKGEIYGFASESLPLTQLKFELDSIKDLPPGHLAIYDSKDGSFSLEKVVSIENRAHCVFEKVYFAWVASKMDGLIISDFRKKLGTILAERFEQKGYEIDAVIAIPNTARTAAVAAANYLKVPYEGELIVRNPFYPKRQFQVQDPKGRGQDLTQDPELGKLKLMIKYEFNPWQGVDRIFIVEDSLIRGNTLVGIFKELLKTVPIKEANVGLTFPPTMFPCPYGIDMQTEDEFFIHKTMKDEDMDKIEAYALQKLREKVGDSEGKIKSVTYIPVKDYGKIVDLNSICFGCCTGEYPNCTLEDITKIGERRRKEINS